MDIGDMDVEELSATWMSAKRAWDRARRQQRRRQAAAEPLTDAEAAALQRAQADFQAAERRWDQAYAAGITIVTDEREDGALAGLYQRVVAAPLDDTPRLAYAEAVQDADPERTEFIWMQIEHRRLRRDRSNEERQRELSLRTAYLRSDRSSEWAREVRTLVAGYQFFRGFVEAVWLDAARFLARAGELYERAPVLQLYLSGAAPVARELFASPHLRRIRGLSLLRCELGDAEAGLIASSPYLSELEWLDLGLNHVGTAGVTALAASAGLPRLGYVGLLGNAVDDPTPQHADDYDADSLLATELQARYGRREWLSAHSRAVWPPDRDLVYPDDPDPRRPL
ncbi:MAG TPA: TIGR02996 domain-containing protein [Streptosporangiaceae bacterium]|nr:TIGR02996 domain-containing protein [Streptosporangiaceae bacterium]